MLKTILAGAVTSVLISTSAMAQDVASEKVVVTFERELPFKTKVFKKTFEDKDAFEMWLMSRLEDKGCDPYLKNMNIEFKSVKEKS